MRIDSQTLLPIRIVFPSANDSRPQQGGGSSRQPFCDVTPELRQGFSDQLSLLEQHFEDSFRNHPNLPGVAKVTLIDKALAKSHRPLDIFNENTCPIIGANRLGELYVSVQPAGLAQTLQVMQKTTKGVTNNLSALQEIKPFTGEDVLSPLRSLESDGDQLSLFADFQSAQDRELLRQRLAPSVKVRLFRYRHPQENDEADRAFLALANDLGVAETQILDYADDLRIMRLRNVPEGAFDALADFVATQSISPFPDYHLVRTQGNDLGSLKPGAFPPPRPGQSYGLVGILDSGTDRNNANLQRWVAARDDTWVPVSQQNNSHGTFVAALIANGRALNHNDPRFPDASCRIVDVVAFDRSERIPEHRLLQILDSSLTKYPQVAVWNLSLGMSNRICNDNEFSEFGSALDKRAQQRNVLFCVAAGNYDQKPYRCWPYPPALGDRDRICPPADSLCALTVGARAHRETAASVVSAEAPSPFTCRGPAPAYLLKPEISHYGGNCDAQGNFNQMGIMSLDVGNRLAENVGTSFAVTFGSSIAGEIFHELAALEEPRNAALVKAMIVHSAFMRGAVMVPVDTHYFGLGIPADPLEIIQCRQSAATLMFKVPLSGGKRFFKDPFPMPVELANEFGLQGEIFMTLLYEPPFGKRHGMEYCRVNVNAALGVMLPGVEKSAFHREVDPYPAQISGGRHEENLVKGGYKWSPLKFYYRKLENVPADLAWRLSLWQESRSEFVPQGNQEVIVLVTIRAANPNAQIYEALTQQMLQLSWATQELRVQQPIQLRV